MAPIPIQPPMQPAAPAPQTIIINNTTGFQQPTNQYQPQQQVRHLPVNACQADIRKQPFISNSVSTSSTISNSTSEQLGTSCRTDILIICILYLLSS